MKKFDGIAAAVLAGGRNSRMRGLNKAFINIQGVPIINRTIGILGDIFEEIIIVTNSIEEFRHFKKTVILAEDIIKNCGPLSGMHSALSHTTKGSVFFVACDMPFLHNDMIKHQIKYFYDNDYDCLVPGLDSKIEPLHAIYKTKLKDNMQAFLENNENLSIQNFLKTVDVSYWDIGKAEYNKKIFSNINTPEQLKHVRGKFICS